MSSPGAHKPAEHPRRRTGPDRQVQTEGLTDHRGDLTSPERPAPAGPAAPAAARACRGARQSRASSPRAALTDRRRKQAAAATTATAATAASTLVATPSCAVVLKENRKTERLRIRKPRSYTIPPDLLRLTQRKEPGSHSFVFFSFYFVTRTIPSRGLLILQASEVSSPFNSGRD